MSGDHLLTAVSVARECGMVPSSHHVIVAEATPTSCLSYHVLGEGKSPHAHSHLTSCDGGKKEEEVGEEEREEEGRERDTTPLITYHSAVDLCPLFHVALDGKSFVAIREKHPQEYMRVSL